MSGHRRAIVLDANILIRLVLGKRVRQLVLDHADRVAFFTPDVAYADARTYLPGILTGRAGTPTPRARRPAGPTGPRRPRPRPATATTRTGRRATCRTS